jgi:hypothetical protein
MSEQAPRPAADAVTGATQKRKRSWRRRILIALLLMAMIAVVLRVVLVLALPPVLRSVAARYGFKPAYDRTELYLLAGDVGIWNFTLAPLAGGEPVLSTEYARADISALNLLRGRLVVRRVEADGVNVLIDRDANGEIPLLKQFISSTATNSTPPPPQPSSDRTLPTAIALDPPLRIDALRVSRARAHLRDRSVTPAVDTTLELTARLSDLGSQVRPTRFLLDITSPPLLDSLRVEGEGTARGQALAATLQFIVRGLHPRPAQGYLLPVGIKPAANDISLAMNARIAAAPTTRPSTTQPADIAGSIVLDSIRAVADGEEFAGVDRIVVDLAALKQGAPHFSSVLIDGAHGSAMRTRTGAIRVAGIELVPASASAPPAKTAPPAPAAPPSIPAAWALDRLAVKNVRGTFVDESVSPVASLAFVADEFLVENIVNDPKSPGAVMTIAGKMSAPGIVRTIQLNGSAVPFGPKQSATLKVLAEGIRPDAIRAYLDAAGLDSQMNDATFACDLNAAATTTPAGTLTANADLSNIRFTDSGELFAFDLVKIAGMSREPRTASTRIESIELRGPRLAVGRERDGSLRAFGMRTKPPVQHAAKAPSPAPASSPPPIAATQPVLPAFQIAN